MKWNWLSVCQSFHSGHNRFGIVNDSAFGKDVYKRQVYKDAEFAEDKKLHGTIVILKDVPADAQVKVTFCLLYTSSNLLCCPGLQLLVIIFTFLFCLFRKLLPVSYTHLDVYKRQTLMCADLRHVHMGIKTFSISYVDGWQRKMPILSRMISKTTAAFSVL